MRELLECLARGLVDHPEEVSVEEFQEDDGVVLLELAVGEDDYGKVIGRSGRTVHALRTVLSAAGRAAEQRERVLIDIVE
ncbi:MAG: KH domain-containing protein [Acidobacteriota bacterium]|nr:KH domain-containing protein [Acidobacteriota bacterium]